MNGPAEQGAYFQYADSGVLSIADVDESVDEWAQRTAPGAGQADGSWVDRALLHGRVRAELRAEHRNLTDRQLDAIATMTVELRRVRVRLGSVSAMVDAATAAPL